MEAALFIGDPGWDRHHQRLAFCLALSAFALLLPIATLDWSPRFDFSRLVPVELEVALPEAPESREPQAQDLPPPQSLPAQRAEEPPLPRVEAEPLPETRAPAAGAAPVEPATQPSPAVPQPAAAAAPTDWYVELEEAAAAVGERAAAEVTSLHPEFEELRRIAAERYGPPQTNPPPLSWRVEKEPDGRTLLRRGNTYMVLDDPRLFNRYAFENFERHMIFVTIPLGKRRPKMLPWVETIRTRYDYMLEPDELPPLKSELQTDPD